MINMIKLKCPNCSADLEVDKDLKQCFCTYCGTKILLSNENEHTYRIVNEADIAREENERRKIEFEQQKYEDNKKQHEKKEKESSRVLLIIGLGIITLYRTIFALARIAVGGFANTVIGLIYIAAICGLWYGYYIISGKTKFKKSIGIAIIVATIIVSVMLLKPTVSMMNAEKTNRVTSPEACISVFSLDKHFQQ